MADLDNALGSFFNHARQYKRSGREGYYLLLDDDEDALTVLTMVLADHGVTDVLTAMSVEEAKERVGDVGRDCIACAVVDYYLPDGIGMDFVEWMLEGGREVPMFLYTASDEAVEEVFAKFPSLTPVLKGSVKALVEALFGPEPES